MRRRGSRNGYFQQRIPVSVKPLAVGRRIVLPVGEGTVSVMVTERMEFIKFSLRSADPTEVKVRQAMAAAHLERVWKALLQAAPVTLTHEQCVTLAGRAYRAWADGQRQRTTGMVRVPLGKAKPGEAVKEWTWQPDDNPMDGVAGLWDAAAKSLKEEALGPLTDRLLLGEGIACTDDASREMLLGEIDKALRQAFEARERNAEGDYRPDPMAERFPTEFARPKRPEPGPVPPSKVSLTGLVEDWWSEAKRGSMALSTYESYRNTARKLSQFLKHDDAARITAEDIIRFKDWRISEGVSPWTVKANDLAGLRTVFGWGVTNRRLTSNPAEGVKVAGSKRPKMRDRGFSAEEARKLLHQASAYGSSTAREHPKMTAAKHWAPWLCAYTGARVGEIVQLRKQDVRRDAELGGALVITITPEAGTVKSKEARAVVLHAHLEDLGFWQFVERSKPGYLFLNIAADEEMRGKWRAAKNRLREFARQVVTSEAVSPNHGWRHTFKTKGREVGIEDSILDAICGHSSYYGTVTLMGQKAALAKFPRFDA